MLGGIRISRDAPTIFHLLFADDNIIFTHALVQEAITIWYILRDYEALSGQKVNSEKCKISFSRKLEIGIRQSINNSLGFTEVKMH